MLKENIALKKEIETQLGAEYLENLTKNKLNNLNEINLQDANELYSQKFDELYSDIPELITHNLILTKKILLMSKK